MCKLLLFVLLVVSCAPFKVPGTIADRPGLDDAERIVWRDSYKRIDSLPAVFVVSGDELNCTSDVNGEPGFNCPTVGCRQGCTGSPGAVHVAEVQPWSRSALAHELWHVVTIRDALATLLSTPATFVGYAGIADRNHSGPAWQPGGDVDRANQLLRDGGL